MFKIAITPSYWAPVTVELIGDGGKIQKHIFECQFRRLTQSELAAYTERLTAQQLDDDALVREVVLDWRGVLDEDGTELTFSPASLTRLLDIYPVRTSIVTAFFASLQGARQKN